MHVSVSITRSFERVMCAKTVYIMFGNRGHVLFGVLESHTFFAKVLRIDHLG